MTAGSRPGRPTAMAPSLFVFALFYGGMCVLGGILGNKQVALGPLAVEAGIFAFLTLVVLSSAVAELHGPGVARRLVLIGFAPLVASMLLIGLVLVLPPAAAMDPARLAAFQLVLGQSPRLMLAGIIAYGVSQMLNVRVFDALRGRAGGVASGRSGWLMVRGAAASALSQIADTVIFITIAFWGVFPIGRLIAGQMLAKVTLSLLVVPPLIQGLVLLGRRLDGDAAIRRSGGPR